MNVITTALVQIDLLEDSHGGERDLLLLAINNMIAGNRSKRKSNDPNSIERRNASNDLSNEKGTH